MNLRFPRTHALLGSLVLVGTFVLGCEETAHPSPEVIRSVLTREVAGPGASRKRAFSGVARSHSQTDLSFQVAGQILAIHVKTGDVISAGTLVAELDPTDFEIALREARAALSQAEAEARNADANYQRMRALYEREGVSRGELDQARASAESTRANVTAARTRVQQSARQLRYTKLEAPSDGAISAVPADVGENIQAGTVIAVFQTGGPPEVEIAMPENLIAGVTVGMPVSIDFVAFPDSPYVGEVEEVGIAPEERGGTYAVTVRIDADWSRIRPGMAADVTFAFERAEDAAIVVPISAVGEDREGHFVFLVQPDGSPASEVSEVPPSSAERLGTTEKRYVEIGAISGDGLAIESGLAGGDQLVVAGVPRIQHGLRVRILYEGEWP